MGTLKHLQGVQKVQHAAEGQAHIINQSSIANRLTIRAYAFAVYDKLLR
jgi:hypothetical protein